MNGRRTIVITVEIGDLTPPHNDGSEQMPRIERIGLGGTGWSRDVAFESMKPPSKQNAVYRLALASVGKMLLDMALISHHGTPGAPSPYVEWPE